MNRIPTTRTPAKRRKFRKGFRKLKQKGRLINLTATVPNRIARLVQTEAAINNTPVSTLLRCILSERYANVR